MKPAPAAGCGPVGNEWGWNGVDYGRGAGQDCGRQVSAPWIGAGQKISPALRWGNDFLGQLVQRPVAETWLGVFATTGKSLSAETVVTSVTGRRHPYPVALQPVAVSCSDADAAFRRRPFPVIPQNGACVSHYVPRVIPNPQQKGLTRSQRSQRSFLVPVPLAPGIHRRRSETSRGGRRGTSRAGTSERGSRENAAEGHPHLWGGGMRIARQSPRRGRAGPPHHLIPNPQIDS